MASGSIMPTLPQTSVMFFALLIGFIVFITVRGELPAYLCVIGLGGKNCMMPAGAPTTTP